MEPVLTFEQWETIHGIYQSMYTTSVHDVAPMFCQLADALRQWSLASAESESYNELADLTRYWISTHYIADCPPRQEARRFWNHWRKTFGPHLERYHSDDWQQFITPRSGYVYVLKMGDWYKIGRTTNVMRRFPQISIKMPLPTRLWALFFVEDMIDEEELLHTYYAPFRTHGEWFALPDEEVQRLYAQQPYSCSHVYQCTNQPDWHIERKQEWEPYYAAYLKRANAEYEQRI